MPKGAKRGQVPAAIEKNQLQGSAINKVVELGLANVANEMRTAGMSLTEICDELNSKYLSDSSMAVSVMSLQRFFNRWSDIDKVDLRQKEQFNINTYLEYKMLYQLEIEMIETLQSSMSKAKKDKSLTLKDIKEISFSISKHIAQAQSLLVAITEMQKVIYSWVTASKFADKMLDKVEQEYGLEGKAKIINHMKSDAELIELMKSIKPDKSQ